MRSSLSAARVFIAVFALLISTPLRAQDSSTFEGVWKDVTQNPDCKSTEYSDFVLVTCDAQLTLWYFTKPNHPAHPGVVKRIIYQEKDGAWLAREEGRSFASDAAQPAFKTWLAQIADLDRQMREQIEKQKGAADK